jgi:hypothetical protein
MSKSNVFENKAFQTDPAGIGFNLISQVNSFHSVFDTKDLDTEEVNSLNSLLIEGVRSEGISNEQVTKDLFILKQITAEIKAIGNQGTVLLGERVYKARDLLKFYKNGTFTRWLDSAFGSRKTGYNVLAYYELYSSLPHDDLRNRFKKLQQRTAYILASREGAIETKSEIINEYHDKSHNEIVILIQEKLPVSVRDRRVSKISIAKLLSNLQENIESLRQTMGTLTQKDKEKLSDLTDLMLSLL